MPRVNIWLPSDVFTKVKKLKEEKGLSWDEFILEVLNAYMGGLAQPETTVEKGEIEAELARVRERLAKLEEKLRTMEEAACGDEL